MACCKFQDHIIKEQHTCKRTASVRLFPEISSNWEEWWRPLASQKPVMVARTIHWVSNIQRLSLLPIAQHIERWQDKNAIKWQNCITFKIISKWENITDQAPIHKEITQKNRWKTYLRSVIHLLGSHYN